MSSLIQTVVWQQSLEVKLTARQWFCFQDFHSQWFCFQHETNTVEMLWSYLCHFGEKNSFPGDLADISSTTESLVSWPMNWEAQKWPYPAVQNVHALHESKTPVFKLWGIVCRGRAGAVADCGWKPVLLFQPKYRLGHPKIITFIIKTVICWVIVSKNKNNKKKQTILVETSRSRLRAHFKIKSPQFSCVPFVYHMSILGSKKALQFWKSHVYWNVHLM